MPAPGPRPAARRGRGRPAQIDRSRIVEAALEVGIRDLTLASVAERLGTTPQAFYRWINNRDELFALVAESLVERVEIPVDDGRPWREWLGELADNIRTVLLGAPGLALNAMIRYPVSPALLRINERACEVLVRAGFSPAEAQQTYLTFGTLLMGWLTREDSLRSDAGLAGDLQRSLDRAEEPLPLVAANAAQVLARPLDDRYSHMRTTLLNGLPAPRPSC